MKRKRRLYLWPDMLWLTLALMASLAACGVEAALDAGEDRICAAPAPAPTVTACRYDHSYTAADARAIAALAQAAEEAGEQSSPLHGSAELYVLTAADKLPGDVPLTDEEAEALLDACEAGHIAPALALGMIYEESRFDGEAVNGPCYGLCQLHTDYFPAGLSPAENITYGIGYLADRLEAYDNLDAGLTAYRWGYDNGDRSYANAVLSAAERFEVEVAK